MSTENNALAMVRDLYIHNKKLNKKYIQYRVGRYVSSKSKVGPNTTVSTKTSDLYSSLVKKNELSIRGFVELFIHILGYKKITLEIGLKMPEGCIVPAAVVLNKDDPAHSLGLLFRTLASELGYDMVDLRNLIKLYVEEVSSTAVSRYRVNQKRTDKINQIRGRVSWKSLLRNAFDILGAETVIITTTIVDDKGKDITVYTESVIKNPIGAHVGQTYRKDHDIELCTGEQNES